VPQTRSTVTNRRRCIRSAALGAPSRPQREQIKLPRSYAGTQRDSRHAWDSSPPGIHVGPPWPQGLQGGGDRAAEVRSERRTPSPPGACAEPITSLLRLRLPASLGMGGCRSRPCEFEARRWPVRWVGADRPPAAGLRLPGPEHGTSTDGPDGDRYARGRSAAPLTFGVLRRTRRSARSTLP